MTKDRVPPPTRPPHYPGPPPKSMSNSTGIGFEIISVTFGVVVAVSIAVSIAMIAASYLIKPACQISPADQEKSAMIELDPEWWQCEQVTRDNKRCIQYRDQRVIEDGFSILPPHLSDRLWDCRLGRSKKSGGPVYDCKERKAAPDVSKP